VRRLVRRRGESEGEGEGGGLGEWLSQGAPDVEHALQNVVERVFKLLDLPRRSDIEALNRNLDRVARAIEALDRERAEDAPTAAPRERPPKPEV
jgi:hypothetical protein